MTMNATWRTASIVAVLCLLGDGSVAESRADTPRFPDIDSYTPVDVRDYTVALSNPGRPPIENAYFATPTGITCNFRAGGGGISGIAGCTADHLPGIDSAGRYTFIGTTAGVQAQSTNPFVDGSIQGHKLNVLPPFHSITVGGITCGVDDRGTTACKDPQGRGFVLSPQGSGWLPEVY